MSILLTGLAIFIAIHLLPTFLVQRRALIDKLGYVPYLVVFSVISLVGFLMIICGFSLAPRTALYSPMAVAPVVAQAVMPLVFILLLSAYLKTHIRDKLKHPMLIATAMWAIVHLLANGDSATVILFAGFLSYAIADILMAKPRESLIPSGAASIVHDAIAVVGGLVLYGVVMQSHQALFGVTVVGG